MTLATSTPLSITFYAHFVRSSYLTALYAGSVTSAELTSLFHVSSKFQKKEQNDISITWILFRVETSCQEQTDLKVWPPFNVEIWACMIYGPTFLGTSDGIFIFSLYFHMSSRLNLDSFRWNFFTVKYSHLTQLHQQNC